MSFDKSSERLSEALPTPGRALFLRTSFNRSLIDSLIYLLEVCEEVTPPDLFMRTKQKLNSLNPQSKLSGLLSTVHVDFFNAAEQKDIQRVHEITRVLDRDDFLIEKINFLNLSNLNNYYTPLIKNIFSQEIEREVCFFSLSAREFDKVKKSLLRCLKILECASPHFFIEFHELVSEVLILKAEGLKGGSSSDVFGMIYKCYLDKWKTCTDILDFLIHEQSHLYIHLLNKDDPLVLNPLERYEAPLRKEKRPLMGIYHATFVLARMQYVLNKALALNEIPENEKEYCEELITYYKKRFQVGFTTLQNHAQMTPLGSALIQSARKLV